MYFFDADCKILHRDRSPAKKYLLPKQKNTLHLAARLRRRDISLFVDTTQKCHWAQVTHPEVVVRGTSVAREQATVAEGRAVEVVVQSGITQDA